MRGNLMTDVIISIALIAAILFVMFLLYKRLRDKNKLKAKRLKALTDINAGTTYSPEEISELIGPTHVAPTNEKYKTMFASYPKIMEAIETINNEAYNMGIAQDASKLVLIWVIGLILVPILLVIMDMDKILILGFVILWVIIAIVFIELQKKRRLQKIEKQLGNALSVICNALRSGFSFDAALNSVAREMEDPIATEFERAYLETQYGLSLPDALKNMAKRCQSKDVALMQNAVSIQNEVGGNVIETLNHIANTIRSRQELKEDIKSKTSAGRLSGYIVGAVPLVLLLVLSVINPDYVEMFFHTTIGNIMLVVAAVFMVVGFVVINKIVNIKFE